MTIFQISAILITLAALGAWINAKLLKLPTTIGLMALAMAGSLGILVVGRWLPGAGLAEAANTLLASIDFNETLLNGMLGFLLFAGALHVNLDDLRQYKLVIGLLATAGVLISTLLSGAAVWAVGNMVGLELAWMHCLIFGALIAPTDPIAVLSILKKLGAPKSLEVTITGESLFNDGVGVVVFLALVGIADFEGHGEQVVTAASVAKLFAVEVIGGGVCGLVLGLVGFWLLKQLNDYATEVLITLAIVLGGYALCSALHLSGPIAMVVAGLLIGNHGRALAMSETTREHLDMFWELIDEVLNAVLFVLIGLEVLILTFDGKALIAGVVMIPAVLLARWMAIGSVRGLMMRQWSGMPPHSVKTMTWSGLRGGISVALALSLKPTLGQAHPQTYQALLQITYLVVAFSILAQGLTIGPMLRKFKLTGSPASH